MGVAARKINSAHSWDSMNSQRCRSLEAPREVARGSPSTHGRVLHSPLTKRRMSMTLFQRSEQGPEERQPEVPRVQIQGDEAVIPRSDEAGEDRTKLSPKTWG